VSKSSINQTVEVHRGLGILRIHFDHLWPYLIIFLFSEEHNESVQLIESDYI